MYYDQISEGYDELHKEEQLKKIFLIKKHLKTKKTDKLLDVGCGTGVSMAFDCWQVGVDPSFNLLKKIKSKKTINAAAEFLPFKDKVFDIVVSVTAVHNFNEVEKGLKEIKRVGNDNFVISVLKKSQKSAKIEKLLAENFTVEDTVEEEKDLIYFLR